MSNLKILVEKSIQDLLSNTLSEKKMKTLKQKHDNKVHFIPYKYRILGGLLQSLNIQFGNFIETLIPKIALEEKNARIEFLAESGKKNLQLSINNQTDRLIDEYMTQRQINLSYKTFENDFETFLQAIFESEKNNPSQDNIIVHDLDMLFRDKTTGKIFYIELKYTDDHDTGKFININSKFLKTFAGLISYFQIEKLEQIQPYIYYFNKIIKKQNHFIYEEKYILRGSAFFDKFLTCKYEELDEILTNISEDPEIIKFFDDLYKKIRFN